MNDLLNALDNLVFSKKIVKNDNTNTDIINNVVNNINEETKTKKRFVKKQQVIKKNKSEFDNSTVSSTDSESNKGKKNIHKPPVQNIKQNIKQDIFIKVKSENITDKNIDIWNFDNRSIYKGKISSIPNDVPKDLIENSKCAVFIDDIDNNITGWKKGVIKEIDKRKKHQDNIIVEITINKKKYKATFTAKKLNYGPDRTWILIE